MNDKQYKYIDTPKPLQQLCQKLAPLQQIAIDTEGDSYYHYFEKVCLIQISAGGQNYIIDPLAKLNLSPLLQILKTRKLILHGADYDLRLMRQSFNFTPDSEVFDTMLAAQLIGCEKLGLMALVEQFCHAQLTKEQQTADWTQRPLPQKLLSYACDDTRYLATLTEILSRQLDKKNRLDWHRQSCQRMVRAAAEESASDPEREWRIKGAGKLSRKKLAFVRAIWYWRDAEARAADLAPFRILRNSNIMHLASKAAATDKNPLTNGSRLPSNITPAQRLSLQQTINHTLTLDPSQYPEQIRSKRPPDITKQCRLRYESLKQECDQLAAQLKIDPALIAPRSALKTIATQNHNTKPQLKSHTDLLPWQIDLITPLL